MITEADFMGALFLGVVCRLERWGGLTSDAKV